MSGNESPSVNTNRGGVHSKFTTESEQERLDANESSSTFLFEAVTTERGKGGGDGYAISSTEVPLVGNSSKSAEGNQNNVPLEGEESRKKKKSRFYPASADTNDSGANDEAVRNRATSSFDICQNIFYLIILCVLVGKLETDYNNFNEEETQCDLKNETTTRPSNLTNNMDDAEPTTTMDVEKGDTKNTVVVTMEDID